MYVSFEKKFKKQYLKADLKIKEAFDKRVKIFKKNPHSSRLDNHRLTGKFRNFRSINITGDWRALYSEHKNGEIIVFELLGTHSQLYK